MPELLTVEEVAALLRTTPNAIRTRVQRGNAPAGMVRNGRRILFRAVDVRREIGLPTSSPSVPPPKAA